MWNEDLSHRKKSFCKKTMRYSMKKRKKNKTPAHKMMADIAISGEKKVPTFGARACLMISFPSCHIMERQNDKIKL